MSLRIRSAPDRHQHGADVICIGLRAVPAAAAGSYESQPNPRRPEHKHRMISSGFQCLAANMTLAATPAIASSVPCAN